MPAEVSIPLALAVHELATNAVKYGSLSVPSGCVSLSWEEIHPAKVRIEWRETGGPSVRGSGHQGFGVKLIRSLPAVEVRHEFLREGVYCAITLKSATPA